MNIEAFIAETAVIKCVNKGSNPAAAPLRWYFNETFLQQTNETQSTLYIKASEATYGVYKCAANNTLGTGEVSIELKHSRIKRVPNTPENITIKEVTSNSFILDFLTDFEKFNFDESLIYHLKVDERSEIKIKPSLKNKIQSIRLEGLKPNTIYIFKIRSSNSAGSSNFTSIYNTTTKSVSLKPDDVPIIQIGYFDLMSESMCFILLSSKKLIDQQFLVRVNIQTYLGYFEAPNTKYETLDLRIKENKSNKLCIPFSEIKLQAEVARNNLISFYVIDSQKAFNLKTLEPYYSQVNIMNVSFSKFTELNRINASICHWNDSTLCSQSILVNYEPNMSMITTIIGLVVFCFLIALLTFVIYKCLKSIFDEEEKQKGRKKRSKVGVEKTVRKNTY